MLICRRFQPKKQAACMGQGALANHPSGHHFAHRAEGDPDPGIPIDFRQFLQRGQMALLLIPTVSPLMISLLYCYIKSFQRASSVEKPWPGGEKRMDGRASHPVAW